LSSSLHGRNKNVDDFVDVALNSDAIPIHHIFLLPTGQLNDLHDYLICYNDGPTNVNFNPSHNDIPPTGMMYGKTATAKNNNKERFGLFTKGVVMADTTSTYCGGNVDKVIDASIT
jgi:hypothetical protein